ncbi:hypothetical protein PQR15_06950 [Streptomyces lydicus]|nr:hypothetical protein [Streptomyces lydicus]
MRRTATPGRTLARDLAVPLGAGAAALLATGLLLTGRTGHATHPPTPPSPSPLPSPASPC